MPCLVAAAAARSAFSPLPLARVRGPPSTARMDDCCAAFDPVRVDGWVAWRASHPVRGGTGGVRRTTGVDRPAILEQQSAWSHYSKHDKDGRTIQEWWMMPPPFLAPIADVASVPKGWGEEALTQCSVDPASGGPRTHQHYTNIRRIARLADCHPMVISHEPFELAVGPGRRQATFNVADRATEFHHQSQFGLLHLSLANRVEMIVGCSVGGANQDRLSLQWGPFRRRQQLTSDQESMAQAVFFDLAEAAHKVPRAYAVGFHAAFGCLPPAAPPAAARDIIRVEPWRSSTAAPSTSTSSTSTSTSSMASTAAPSTASAAPSTSSSAWRLTRFWRCRNCSGG